jgi:hypothetical protein
MEISSSSEAFIFMLFSSFGNHCLSYSSQQARLLSLEQNLSFVIGMIIAEL